MLQPVTPQWLEAVSRTYIVIHVQPSPIHFNCYKGSTIKHSSSLDIQKINLILGVNKNLVSPHVNLLKIKLMLLINFIYVEFV
jgi:hypothetical protein